ncbi:DUF1653 domain-containing protein [Amycolatopsis sp. NPDC004368]
MTDEIPVIHLDYTDRGGSRGMRQVRPHEVWRNGEKRWLLKAFDTERRAVSNFALTGIHNWQPAPDQELPPDLHTGVYRHFKGGLYLVTGNARHSDNADEVVVYRTLYGTFSSWVRPLAEFRQRVKNPAGEGELPRFTFVDAL